MIEDVDLNKETTLRLAEHEILMSFNNDSGAYRFDEWWFQEGKDMFDKWCEEYSEDNE